MGSLPDAMDEVRRLCREITAGPPPAVSLPDFCARLARRRDRPILLLPFVGDGQSPSGVWLKGTRQDYVCYDAAASPVHQEAIARDVNQWMAMPGDVPDRLDRP